MANTELTLDQLDTVNGGAYRKDIILYQTGFMRALSNIDFVEVVQESSELFHDAYNDVMVKRNDQLLYLRAIVKALTKI